MATTYPTTLDAWSNPSGALPLGSANPVLVHSTMHAAHFDAVEALEAKVGVDASAVSTSHDYKIERMKRAFVVTCSDESTAITAGTDKVKFRMPHALTVTAVRASLSTTQTSGNIFTVDIHESGTTILSTKITIDNGEKTSTTAATAPVISDTALADDAEITFDVDQVGDGTAIGLKVYIIGYVAT